MITLFWSSNQLYRAEYVTVSEFFDHPPRWHDAGDARNAGATGVIWVTRVTGASKEGEGGGEEEGEGGGEEEGEGGDLRDKQTNKQ